MKELFIKRIARNDHGTFGVWIDNGIPFAVSLEPESEEAGLIPAGTYLCKRDYYHKGKYATFEITGVPGKTRVLIHKGNKEEDTRACVLIAEEFGVLDEKPAVLSSGKAFIEFMGKVEGIDQFNLTINDA